MKFVSQAVKTAEKQDVKKGKEEVKEHKQKKEKNTKEIIERKSQEGFFQMLENSLGFWFPWINKKNEKKGLLFRVKSGAERHSSYTPMEIVSFVAVAMTLLNCAVLIYRYILAFCGLEKVVVINNFIVALLIAILPFIFWLRATDENFWAFHRRKRLFFSLALVHAALCLMQSVYSLIWSLIVPFILNHVPTNAAMTGNMVRLLAYLGEGILFIAMFILAYRIAEPLLKSKTTWRSIEVFKLKHIVDSRKDAENRYDFHAIIDLETGKPITVKENDRYVQTEINGASGTGKTSSIFLNGIWGDLNVKFKNREARREAFRKMIEEGRATLRGPLAEFDESAVIAIGEDERELKKNEKEIETIKSKYPDCGITVVAPNPDLNENVIRMAEARGFKVNVLDPVNSYSKWKYAKEMAINPFYIPFGLEESERVIRISQAASNFADVLIATNQMGGSSDVYFTDISLSVSSNAAAVVMLANNLMGKQTYIDDVHECISDFGNLSKYVETIESAYGIKIVVDDPRAKGENASTEARKKESAGKSDEKARKNPYYQQLLFVKQELLGPGREAMFSQSRGLRNLMAKILQDPRIRKKLSADDASRIDFDGILSKNEITVVSTAVELGQSISTSFGIFFLLLHRMSVLRRPKATRTPHFLWVDECAQYVHPLFDDVIALYRQYRVAAVLTLQTLTQLEKHRDTAYLKNVFLGAGTHILFGRVAVEEMELYGKMAGQIREDIEQVSSSSNDVLASSPTYMESTRKTPTVSNVMEGSDLRILDFQELTFFTIDGGRVLYGKHARVFFLPDEAYDEMKQKEINWKALVPEAFREDASEDPHRENLFEEADNSETAERISAEIEQETPEELSDEPEEETSYQFYFDEELQPAVKPAEPAGEIPEEEKTENDLKKMIDSAGDLSEIYSKLESGKW